MAQRITRAKAKIRAAHIPYRVPTGQDIGERLSGVLAVVYLVFNEGYLAGGGTDPLRVDLTDEAIRLGRLLRTLVPDDGEVAGLLALMLLTDARRPARFSGTGELVTLAEQDRGLWEPSLLAEGLAIVRERATTLTGQGAERPGRYQLLAAINAVHSLAPTPRGTDWAQVLALYDVLLTVDPSPIVRLNRAVALAETAGAEVALVEVDAIADRLEAYHALHLTRADLLGRVGRDQEARVAYDRAIARTGNVAEQEHLARRRDQLRR